MLDLQQSLLELACLAQIAAKGDAKLSQDNLFSTILGMMDVRGLTEVRRRALDHEGRWREVIGEAVLQDVPALPLPEAQPRKRPSRPRSAA